MIPNLSTSESQLGIIHFQSHFQVAQVSIAMILSPPPPPPQPQMLKTDPNLKSSQVLISLVYKNEIFNTQYP